MEEPMKKFMMSDDRHGVVIVTARNKEEAYRLLVEYEGEDDIFTCENAVEEMREISNIPGVHYYPQ